MSRKFTATVKEGLPDPKTGHAPVSVVIEADEDVGLGPDETITIQFRPGAPYATAQAVATSLNENAYAFKIRS